MKALVTGAAGLVGSHVCRALVERGDEVRAGVHNRASEQLEALAVNPVRIDIRDESTLIAAMTGVDVVIHCAAIYSYARGAELEQVNVAGTRRVVAAAARAGVARVVVTSSAVTCGSTSDPVSLDESGALRSEYAPAYFASKVRQESAALAAAHEHDIDVVIACPTVVLGGRATRLVPSNAIILRYLLDPWRRTFPGGCNLVSAADAAAGHVVLAGGGQPGQRYLLGGENLSWRTIHSIIGDLTGIGGPYAEISTTAAYLASIAAEGWARLTGTESVSSRDEALTVGRYYWYSHCRAAELGYVPGPARAAIAEALAWLLASSLVPRWVREGLRLTAEVREARPLVPRPL